MPTLRTLHEIVFRERTFTGADASHVSDKLLKGDTSSTVSVVTDEVRLNEGSKKRESYRCTCIKIQAERGREKFHTTYTELALPCTLILTDSSTGEEGIITEEKGTGKTKAKQI